MLISKGSTSQNGSVPFHLNQLKLFEIDLLHAVWDSVRIKLHDNYLKYII